MGVAMCVTAQFSSRVASGEQRAWHGALHVKEALSRSLVSRRLSNETGPLTDGCLQACPGAIQVIALSASGGEVEMDKFCPYIGALNCMASTSDCHEEGKTSSEVDAKNIECMCTCPKFFSLGEGEEAAKKICADFKGTLGCVKTAACKYIRKSLYVDETISNMALHCSLEEEGCYTMMSQVGNVCGMG